MLFANNKTSLLILSCSPSLLENVRHVPLQPGNFLGRIFETRAGATHSGLSMGESLYPEPLYAWCWLEAEDVKKIAKSWERACLKERVEPLRGFPRSRGISGPPSASKQHWRLYVITELTWKASLFTRKSSGLIPPDMDL